MSSELKKSNKAIDPNLGHKAMIASYCYMGLGQFAFLKQRWRGLCLMLVEAWVLIDVILGICNVFIPGEFIDSLYLEEGSKIALFFNDLLLGFLDLVNVIFCNNTIINGLRGVITLGDPCEPGTPVKERDHSIFMLITGIMIIVFLAVFIYLYIATAKSAKRDGEKIVKKGKFPTRKETHDDLQQNAFAVIGITPPVLLIVIFTLIPLIFCFCVGFTNYSSPDHIPPNNLVDWVGFENFKTMFSLSSSAGWSKAFLRITIWTFVWAVLSTFTCFFLGFFYAVVLQDKRIKFPSFYRVVFIIPYAIPTMLSLLVWANLLNGTMGPINIMLNSIGIPSIPWLSNPRTAKLTLVLINMWIGFPYSMILITSSMTAIPASMYEAAQIDGATKFQQFKAITLPIVLYQLKPTLIMQFAGNINNFGAVFFLTGGGPALIAGEQNLSISTQAGATDLFISWIYKLTMNSNEYNIACVLAILVFIVLVPFSLYNFMRTKSFKDSEI